uniref:Uncharacterized protein n=1 Tax=Romanomermis culicivorax TaxID=13658 RepID=A0A915KW21_ROMCU
MTVLHSSLAKVSIILSKSSVSQPASTSTSGFNRFKTVDDKLRIPEQLPKRYENLDENFTNTKCLEIHPKILGLPSPQLAGPLTAEQLPKPYENLDENFINTRNRLKRLDNSSTCDCKLATDRELFDDEDVGVCDKPLDELTTAASSVAFVLWASNF